MIILENPISGISPIRTLSTIKLNDTIDNNQCIRMKIIESFSSFWNSSIFTSQTVPQKIFMDELELKDRLNHSVFSEATDELRIVKYFFHDGYYFLSTKDQKFNEHEKHNLRGSLLLCQSDNYPASFVLAGILIDTIDGFPLYDFISQNKKIQDQLDIIEGLEPKFKDNNLELILRSDGSLVLAKPFVSE
ncbi:hypothetical protein KQX54_010542 [Cotesia glomerata]|uniref:Uncharacterized protein n=1 Tax=Cotesia glomerata TaxID=32391 RepID=A0AAV7J2Z0_COTGL|nr:hypothetical protein KQX54_010542 [Cotesia glomerata]